MSNELTKKDIIILILLIFTIGMYFGSLYADTNWKNNLNNFAKKNIDFRFDNSGNYYSITKYYYDADYMYSIINTTINNT